jgi:GNAT superfamily N-acetyltransferase
MEIVALAPAHAAAWAALFEACSSPCFCRYWHFEGGKNDWLARCAGDAAENQREQLARVDAGDAAARGLLAMQEGVAIGWMKLAPRSCLGKLTNLAVYRHLDAGHAAGVYSIGCMLVHPGQRRRGVARALVLAADAHVRAWGGHAVEAYPRHCDGPLHDEEAWMGPERVFIELGYLLVAGAAPYPLYRKDLPCLPLAHAQ